MRADLCMTKEEAVEVSQRKGRQIIDQNPRLFDDPEDMGPVWKEAEVAAIKSQGRRRAREVLP